MKNNIVLVGFMGVGKSSIAYHISKINKMDIIDTDDIIEIVQQRQIKKIFEESGEKYFRNLENNVAKWVIKSINNSIISTGGGFYNVNDIKSLGTIVFLKNDFKNIYETLQKCKNPNEQFEKRPLLNNKVEAEKLFNERMTEYSKIADITIETNGRNLKTISKEIIQKLSCL